MYRILFCINIEPILFYGLLCHSQVTVWRLPIHHTHNILDGYFGLLSISDKGTSGNGKNAFRCGQGSLSQQDWTKRAESTLSTADVEVVQTNCLYDFTAHYKKCIDPKFTGFGPGSPVRVMEFTLSGQVQIRMQRQIQIRSFK